MVGRRPLTVPVKRLLARPAPISGPDVPSLSRESTRSHRNDNLRSMIDDILNQADRDRMPHHSFANSLLWATGILLATHLSGQEKLPLKWESDATLRSVHFIDHDFGWAVGDRGTILRTEDGGRNWQSISSPRDIIWTNVQFIDDRTGWIAGGFFRGGLNRSVGIIIHTTDGGKSWRNLSQKGLPFIEKLEFVDPQTGWMFCEGNSIHPSGLLVTDDGGRSWRSIAGVPARPLKIGWQTAIGRFAGVETTGNWVEYDRTGIQQSTPVELQQPTAVISLETGRTICIDAGRLRMAEPGAAFQACSTGAHSDGPVNDVIHWNQMFKRGNHLWAVGSPGCVILHSPDGGQTWNSHQTGLLESLRATYFLDADRGWAVGDCGKIIVTKDGGQTWTVQRNSDLRLGVLHLVSGAEFLNSPSLALLSGSFSHRCGVAVVTDRTTSSLQHAWRVIQGANRLGVSSFDQRISPAAENLFHCVQLLRTKRPAVVMLHDSDQALNSLIVKSVRAAADPNQYPVLSDLGVRPWQVEKVIAVSSSRELDHNVSTDQFSAHLGRTVSLQSRFASDLIEHAGPDHRWASNANTLSWRLIFSDSRSVNRDQGLTTGTAAYNHPDCRRPDEKLQIDNMQQFRSIANWNQNLARLARLFIFSQIDEQTWLDQVTAATSGMDSLSLSFFLEDLEFVYTEQRKPIMADHTARLILQKVIDSEVGERTLWKMIQRYGSEESNRELNRLVQARMSAQANPVIDPQVQPAGALSPLDPVRPAGNTTASDVAQPVDVTPASLRNAQQLIGIFLTEFPELGADIEYEIPIAWLRSRLGDPSTFLRLIDSLNGRAPTGLAFRRLLREKRLADSVEPAKDWIVARQVRDAEIVLDGLLNERPWQEGYGDDGPPVRFALDKEYLYVAGKIVLEAAVEHDRHHTRTRDESLLDHDRIQILLDFDRDYASGIELSVDTRGACNDAIWRDALTKDYSFDPTWYVASRASGNVWCFEFAIPLDELPIVGDPHSPRWIVGVRFAKRQETSAKTIDAFWQDEKLLVKDLPKQDLPAPESTFNASRALESSADSPVPQPTNR